MENYSVGQKVFINSSSSGIGYSTVRVTSGIVKAISKTGVIKVECVDKYEMSFLANGQQRGDKYGASLVTQEIYNELRSRQLYQGRQRLVSNRIKALEEFVSPHKQDKAEMLKRIEELRLAVEAL